MTVAIFLNSNKDNTKSFFKIVIVESLIVFFVNYENIFVNENVNA